MEEFQARSVTFHFILFSLLLSSSFCPRALPESPILGGDLEITNNQQA